MSRSTRPADDGRDERPSPVDGTEAARVTASEDRDGSGRTVGVALGDRALTDVFDRFGLSDLHGSRWLTGVFGSRGLADILDSRGVTTVLDSRAVSDTLGYAITLGMILSMITFLYVSGVGTFADLQDDARAVNADRAFEILDDNFRDVYERGAPSRAIELKLSSAQVSVTGQTRFEVTVTDPDGPVTTNYPLTFVPVEYTTGDTTMSYENGAVVRRDDGEGGGGAVMDSEPPFVFTDDKTVMTSVVTRGADSIAGDGSVLIVAQRTDSQLLTDVDESGGDQVEVQFSIESPNAPAWKRYLESSLPGGFNTIDGDASDDTLEYSFETDRFVLRQTKLSITLE